MLHPASLYAAQSDPFTTPILVLTLPGCPGLLGRSGLGRDTRLPELADLTPLLSSRRSPVRTFNHCLLVAALLISLSLFGIFSSEFSRLESKNYFSKPDFVAP
ncbi:unnamed protein product [Protopolystoma xenopodis]|uniref:Uncharacterized protein n=1 Tax=Protopolystoma xenopodis TaxID=117903 RepID=A0A448W9Z4_9PLAT|nr:unnamed protein product [Protopolystoma xenopodis]